MNLIPKLHNQEANEVYAQAQEAARAAAREEAAQATARYLAMSDEEKAAEKARIAAQVAEYEKDCLPLREQDLH